MRVAAVEHTVLSVPYRHREVSSIVARDGVTDVLVRVRTDDGLEGLGEACSGADVASVRAALEAMTPFVLGRDPWNREAIRDDLQRYGLWAFREPTGNFAWAGLDMALWDLCGQAAGQPLHRLLGGLRRQEATYFYYLARGSDDELRAQCRDGLERGYDVYYLKVGLDLADDLRMVGAVRDALGPGPRLRLDANAAWTPFEARRAIPALAEHDIDFFEQPVGWHPLSLMREARGYGAAVAHNEGLWTEADAHDRIAAESADVVCFSPYWVGSLGAFVRLGHLAAHHGTPVCRHTHGELGLAAVAFHHAVLALPLVVDGHQQTAQLMAHDVLREPIPIEAGPRWGVPDGPGLGVTLDEDAVAEAAERYRRDGQFRPWQPEQLGREQAAV